MAGGNQNESFAETIRRAQDIPDDTGKGANVLLSDMFASKMRTPPGEPVIKNVPAPAGPDSLAGIPEYNLKPHLKQFRVGRVLDGFDDHGVPQYEDVDESQDYEKLLQTVLDGDAILRWEEKKTLKDGAFVITVCYLTKKTVKKKRNFKINEDVTS